MKTRALICVVALLQAVGGVLTYGQQVAAPPAPVDGMLYGEIKTWHEYRSTLDLTKAQRMSDFQTIVRSKVGQTRLEGPEFRNLSGINPTIPGVDKAILLVASVNDNQSKGAKRTLLFAQAFERSGLYQVVGYDVPINTPLGKTDIDLVVRNKQTGQMLLCESKQERNPNLSKAKLKMDKYEWYARRNNAQTAWLAGRNEVPAELKAYGEERGFRVYDKISTGLKGSENPRNTSFKSIAEELHAESVRYTRLEAINGGAQVGFGLLLLYQSVPAAYEDTLALLDPSTRNMITWLRFGEHGSLVLAGSSMTVEGGAELVSLLANRTETLTTISRWGGRVGIAAIILTEGFIICEYGHGDLTPRQFAMTQANLGGGVAGSLAGAWAGGEIAGLAFAWCPVCEPFAIPIGALIGGFGGGYAGSKLASWGAESYYQFKDAQQQQQSDEFVYRHYGLSL